MKASWVARFAVAAALVGTTAYAQVSDDVVKPRSGEQLVGKLKSDDYASVQITVKNKTIEVARKDIESITYGDESALSPANAALSNGDLDGAAAKLIEPSKKGRKILRQRALFLLATAFFRKGVPDQAAENVTQLRTEFPTGRFAADVVRLEVDAALQRKDNAAATAAIERALREGKAAGLPPAFELELGLSSAHVAEASGNLEQAAAKYRDLVSKAGPEEGIAAEARLGQARCDQATGRADQADATYREILARDIHPRRLAIACNGIGDIQLDKGSKSKDEGALLDAAYMYLRGYMLYSGLPGEADTELARSLAGTARAFSLLADIQTDEGVKTTYRQRSNDHWNMLRTQLPAAATRLGAPGAAAAAPAPNGTDTDTDKKGK